VLCYIGWRPFLIPNHQCHSKQARSWAISTMELWPVGSYWKPRRDSWFEVCGKRLNDWKKWNISWWRGTPWKWCQQMVYHSVSWQCYTVVRVTQQVNGKWQFWGCYNKSAAVCGLAWGCVDKSLCIMWNASAKGNGGVQSRSACVNNNNKNNNTTMI